jgi:hypothetical protein
MYVVFQNTITLYIQMELCTMTLQDWMHERNSTLSSVEGKQGWE